MFFLKTLAITATIITNLYLSADNMYMLKLDKKQSLLSTLLSKHKVKLKTTQKSGLVFNY